MELENAVHLIERGVSKNEVQVWADLGAGSGLFTRALSRILKEGSTIVAIDKSNSKIEGPGIKFKKGNFLDLDFENVDGVVMANSLHYVKNQKHFIEKLSTKTKRLILVEYNTDKGNLWVPHAISFKKLKSFFPEAQQIGEELSNYHKEGMYSALIVF